MSNVKPGDLAQVIADPSNQKITGLTVSVVGPSTNMDHVSRVGCAWRVMALESRAINERHSSLKSPIKAGQELSVDDRILKKIEPPKDSEWLWLDRPLEHDRQPEKTDAIRG